MDLGKKIKQLRLKAGFTQEQLAEKMGVGAQSVSKWENSVSLPDITSLPLLAEVFGVSIDEMFDLSVEQKLNRMENRMDCEEELPQDIFREYEEFLKTQIVDERYRKRATELAAYLYWHRMFSDAAKVRKFAKEAIRRDPAKKGCQGMLSMAENHYIWDWNMGNHSRAIEFYREVVEEKPEIRPSYYYLIDNLIADRRTDEAEYYLGRLEKLSDRRPIIEEVYRAHIALARFDERKADDIMERLLEKYPDENDCLFEAAQYYARKCAYKRAIELYEIAFAKDTRRPRYQDALMGISQIYEIMGDYKSAAATYDRIVDLLKNEWGLTEEFELKDAERERDRLREKAR